MKNLRALRAEKGISQQTLADMFHLSQQSIYKYENDLAEPNLDTLRDFADYFGCSIDYLVDYRMDKSREPDLEPTYLELEIIDCIRNVNPITRQYLIEYLKHMDADC